MKKVLVAYYPFGETTKVVTKLNISFSNRKILSQTYIIEDKHGFSIKEQFKREKEITLKNELPKIDEFDFLMLGTPVVSFSSAPIVNHFLKSFEDLKGKKVILFTTGIGLPGTAMKKMKGILSMKGAEIVDTEVFSSIFPFDERKLNEVEKFVLRFEKKI